MTGMAKRGRPFEHPEIVSLDCVRRAKDQCDFERYYRALWGFPEERKEFFKAWPGSRSAKYAILKARAKGPCKIGPKVPPAKRTVRRLVPYSGGRKSDLQAI
jgi:hypothetical protein